MQTAASACDRAGMRAEGDLEIALVVPEGRAAEVVAGLESARAWPEGALRFRVQREQALFRAADSEIIIAVVSGASAVLGAFVQKVLDYAVGAKARRIVVKNGDDLVLDIPADLETARLREVMAVLNDAARPRIEIVSK